MNLSGINTYNIKVTNPEEIVIRSYSVNNINTFTSTISGINWNNIYLENDVNSAFNMFLTIFKGIYDKCFPLICVKRKKHKTKCQPWISTAIMTSIKRKNKLYKIKLKHPSPNNMLTFRRYRNKLNHVIRIAKRKHFASTFDSCKHDSRKTWSKINDILNKGNKKQTYPSNVNVNGAQVTEPDVINNGFNNYFVNIGPSLARK